MKFSECQIQYIPHWMKLVRNLLLDTRSILVDCIINSHTFHQLTERPKIQLNAKTQRQNVELATQLLLRVIDKASLCTRNLTLIEMLYKNAFLWIII